MDHQLTRIHSFHVEKMLKMIEPEDYGIDNIKNGKFGICFESVHLSIFKKYNGPYVETQCGMRYGAIKAISDARNTHMDNSVLKVGREGAQMSLLDTHCYDDIFPFVQIDANIMNILKGICRPYKAKGSSTSKKDDYLDFQL